MENQELLTIEEMAQRLKVAKSWVYSRTRLRGDEAMPGIRRIGKYVRIEPVAFMAGIEKQSEVQE